MTRKRIPLIMLLLALMACEEVYPEVVVINNTREDVILRNISFNGCRWDVVLAYGESTPPGSCLPGEDQVHFEKFSAATYEEDSGNSEEKDGDVEINPPMWFRYQTVKVHRVDYGEFHLISLELDTLEQDFSVPGPYGH